jgi:hypothetical protein
MARCIIAASTRCECGRTLRALLAVAMACLLLPAEANAAAGCYHVVNVDLWDVLYIRSRKDHRSTAVGAIAPDHSGILRATGRCDPPGANRKRQWCPVDYFPLPTVRMSGFVKAYFIEPRACPPG